MSIEIGRELATLVAAAAILDRPVVEHVERWQATIHAAHACAEILRKLPLEELAAAGRHAEATGWIVDPTLYREKAPALRTDLEVLRAAGRFAAEVEAALVRARAEVKA